MTDDIKAIRGALAAAQKGGDIALHALYDTCHPERIARLLDALEAAQKDAERYRWIRQVAEGEADNGEFCALIKLYGLQGKAEDAFLLNAPHLTDAIDAAMSAAPQSPPADRAAGESVSNPQR